MNLQEKERKELQSSKPDFQKKLNEAKAESTKVLVEGDMFKKWPGGRKFEENQGMLSGALQKLRKGQGFTVRKVFAAPDLSQLNWSDHQTGKTKGYIALGDVVCVDEDETDKDKLRFTVFSKGRALDLEAKSVAAREKFVRALRFFIEYHKTNPPPRPKDGASKKNDE